MNAPQAKMHSRALGTEETWGARAPQESFSGLLRGVRWEGLFGHKEPPEERKHSPKAVEFPGNWTEFNVFSP